MKIVAYLMAMLCLGHALAADAPVPPNLVQNPGFEAKGAEGQPSSWSGPADVYSHVTSPARTGTGALQFVNADKSKYALCGQTIPLEPGKAYEFSGWVKCEGVEGTDTGATICLEWYSAEGQYLGGSYPSGVKGTTDWTLVKGETGRIPPTAKSCSITCYVRKEMTGKAWWDDVTVTRWLEPPLQTMLVRPNYRGQITPETRQIELAADLALSDYDLAPGDVRLKLSLVSKAQGTVREQTVTPTTPHPRVSMSTNGLAEGKYDLQTQLIRVSDQKVLGVDHWRILVPKASELANRPAYIDGHNRLIVNGKPFFPLGMYWSGLKEADLKLYSDSAFNTIMPYGAPDKAGLDLAQRYGQKVIYSVKDVYVGTTWAPQGLKTPEDERKFIETATKAYRNHPALLAWYLNDELSIDKMASLEAHQEWLEELDPGHPTWIVLYQVGQLHLYRKTFDVLGTDPYPIPSVPARQAARYTVMSRDSVLGSRPIWQVPQSMNWASYRTSEEEKKECRPPTLGELRSMSWQCITEGATGLIYYSSLFYSMDIGDTKGEHGGIHEAAIGLGNFAGPAAGAVSLHFLPQYANSGTLAVTGLLLLGLGGLLVIWRRGNDMPIRASV
ncbi:MAG: hypothetical protein WCP21_12045 [Armatimonadota bacterium]